jgi:hypothetical protein
MTETLTSWRDGEAKRAITDFVERVCREGSRHFVAPPARIAVFDNTPGQAVDADARRPHELREKDLARMDRVEQLVARYEFSLSKCTHADHTVVDNTKVVAPIGSRLECRRHSQRYSSGRRHLDTKQNDTLRGLRTATEYQFTKILVEGDEQPRFAQGLFQNRIVGKTRMRLVNPQHIMSPTPQQSDAVSRHVFVSTQAHRVCPFLMRGGEDLFIEQEVSCVSEAGAHVFLCKTGIISQNLFLAPSLGEQSQYKFNRQSGSANNRFACKNGWIGDNVLMPTHGAKLASFPDTSKRLLSPHRDVRSGDKHFPWPAWREGKKEIEDDISRKGAKYFKFGGIK